MARRAIARYVTDWADWHVALAISDRSKADAARQVYAGCGSPVR